MRGLIQRVSQASVTIDGQTVGEIGHGLLLLLGVEKGDGAEKVERLVSRVINYRVFGDDRGHMNLSLLDTGGSLLVVSQFTLSADTRKGLRPSFSSAAPPDEAAPLVDLFIEKAAEQVAVQTGRFGADMQVALTNDGPVTFLLEV